jgi:hypothetical protein
MFIYKVYFAVQKQPNASQVEQINRGRYTNLRKKAGTLDTLKYFKFPNRRFFLGKIENSSANSMTCGCSNICKLRGL